MSRPSNNFYKLDMLVLKIISVEDCYGYQISQTLKRLTDNHISLKEGTLYPILYRLIDNGYITDEKVLVGKRQTRVYYHLEPKGKEYLNEMYEEYFQTIKSIEHIMTWEGDQNE